MASRKYDSTVARIAGNLLGGYCNESSTGFKQVPGDATYGTWVPCSDADAVRRAVACARAIVAEVERTEPKATDGD